MRTPRSASSGENFGDFLISAPCSQTKEPPQKPGRFTVEALKKQAKKLQRKSGGKHADWLNRVAKSAGYDHWHHVTLCLQEFEQQRGVDALDAECDIIVRAAVEGIEKVIVTGPEVLPVPFILFASQGDAWLLDPDENLAFCLMFQGQKMPRHFRDSAQQIEIRWDGEFQLDGDAFAVETEHPAIGTRVILGYPLAELRPHIDKAQSFQGSGEQWNSQPT